MFFNKSLISAVSVSALLCYQAHAIIPDGPTDDSSTKEEVPFKPVISNSPKMSVSVPYKEFEGILKEILTAKQVVTRAREFRTDKKGQFKGWDDTQIKFFCSRAIEVQKRVGQASHDIFNMYLPQDFKRPAFEPENRMKVMFSKLHEGEVRGHLQNTSIDKFEDFVHKNLAHAEDMPRFWISGLLECLMIDIQKYVLKTTNYSPNFDWVKQSKSQNGSIPESVLRELESGIKLYAVSVRDSWQNTLGKLGLSPMPAKNKGNEWQINLMPKTQPPSNEADGYFGFLHYDLLERTMDVRVDFSEFCAPLVIHHDLKTPFWTAYNIDELTPTIDLPSEEFRIPLPFGKQFVQAKKDLDLIERLVGENKKRNQEEVRAWTSEEKTLFVNLIRRYIDLTHGVKMATSENLRGQFKRVTSSLESQKGISSSSSSSTSSSSTSSFVTTSNTPLSPQLSLFFRVKKRCSPNGISSFYMVDEPSSRIEDLSYFLDDYWVFDEMFDDDWKKILSDAVLKLQKNENHSQEDFNKRFEQYVLPGVQDFSDNQHKCSDLGALEDLYVKLMKPGINSFIQASAGAQEGGLVKGIQDAVEQHRKEWFEEIENDPNRHYTPHHVEAVKAIENYLASLIRSEGYKAAESHLNADTLLKGRLYGSHFLKDRMVKEQRYLRRLHKDRFDSEIYSFIQWVDLVDVQRLGICNIQDYEKTSFFYAPPLSPGDSRPKYSAYKARQESEPTTVSPGETDQLFRWEAYRTALLGIANNRGVFDWDEIANALGVTDLVSPVASLATNPIMPEQRDVSSQASSSSSSSTSSLSSSATDSTNVSKGKTPPKQMKKTSKTSLKFTIPSVEDDKKAKKEAARKIAAQRDEEARKAALAAEEARRKADEQAEAEERERAEKARIEDARREAETQEKKRQSDEDRARELAKKLDRERVAEEARLKHEQERLAEEALKETENDLKNAEKERQEAVERTKREREEARLKTEADKRDAERVEATAKKLKDDLVRARAFKAQQDLERQMKEEEKLAKQKARDEQDQAQMAAFIHQQRVIREQMKWTEADPLEPLRNVQEEVALKAQAKAAEEAREEAIRLANLSASKAQALIEQQEMAARQAREEAEHQARKNAEQRAREKAEHEGPEEAIRVANLAASKAQALIEQQEMAARQAREEAEHQTRKNAEQRAREKAERREREQMRDQDLLLAQREEAALFQSEAQQRARVLEARRLDAEHKAKAEADRPLEISNASALVREFARQQTDSLAKSIVSSMSLEELAGLASLFAQSELPSEMEMRNETDENLVVQPNTSYTVSLSSSATAVAQVTASQEDYSPRSAAVQLTPNLTVKLGKNTVSVFSEVSPEKKHYIRALDLRKKTVDEILKDYSQNPAFQVTYGKKSDKPTQVGPFEVATSKPTEEGLWEPYMQNAIVPYVLAAIQKDFLKYYQDVPVDKEILKKLESHEDKDKGTRRKLVADYFMRSAFDILKRLNRMKRISAS